jgi:hypothetical protein
MLLKQGFFPQINEQKHKIIWNVQAGENIEILIEIFKVPPSALS